MAKWYDDYLTSDHWQRTRITKLLSADIDDQWQVIKCNKCGLFVPLEMIDIHHLTYERVGRELQSDLDIWCRSCHRVHHGYATAMWWDFAKKNGMKMILQPQVRRFFGVKKVGDVMMECLAFADERHVNVEFRRFARPKHPAKT